VPHHAGGVLAAMDSLRAAALKPALRAA